MFLDADAATHILNTTTRFSVATILDRHSDVFGRSVEKLWLEFVINWYLVCSSYSSWLRTDQGSVITFDSWKHLQNLNRIRFRISEIEAHSFLGIGEHLHDCFWRICRKKWNNNFPVSPQYPLKVAIKAINGSIEENGLDLYCFVLGVIPWFPTLSTNLPVRKEWIGARICSWRSTLNRCWMSDIRSSRRNYFAGRK